MSDSLGQIGGNGTWPMRGFGNGLEESSRCLFKQIYLFADAAHIKKHLRQVRLSHSGSRSVTLPTMNLNN